MSNFTARLCLFIVVASRSEKLPIVLSLPFCFCLHGGLRVFRLRLGCSKVSQFISRKSEILRRFSTGLFCAALRMLGAEGGGGGERAWPWEAASRTAQARSWFAWIL